MVALDGAPGVRSARWAGPERDFARAMARVRDGLIERYGAFESADRRAAFVAALCLAWPDGHEELVEGRVEGSSSTRRAARAASATIRCSCRKARQTFAEMTATDKQALSHRARALHQLRARCFGAR